MMSRLEEIKAQYHLLKRNGYDLGSWDEPFSWLIQQAERTEHLKRENAGLHDILEQMEYQEKDKLFGENKRYKQALEKLVNAPNDMSRGRYADHAEMIARDALKGVEPSE